LQRALDKGPWGDEVIIGPRDVLGFARMAHGQHRGAFDGLRCGGRLLLGQELANLLKRFAVLLIPLFLLFLQASEFTPCLLVHRWGRLRGDLSGDWLIGETSHPAIGQRGALSSRTGLLTK
jgi:hypothetical protein